MSYNGSGTFNINTSGQPVVTGTVISSTAFNALTADLGTGLSTAITKDGQTTTTAKIPFAQGMSAAVASNFAAGTVAAPGIYLSTDTGTGLYRIGANNDGFAINGAKVLDIASTGLAVTGTLSATTTVAGSGGASTLSVPTRQVFLTGSAATYTTPANCRRIVVRMKGGGGGSAGGADSSNNATSGGTGGTTTFNSINANGGAASTFGSGAAALVGGAGGTAGSGAASLRISGAPGSPAHSYYATATNVNVFGGAGGGTGGGKTSSAAVSSGAGNIGVANSGGGASGGAPTNNVAFASASAVGIAGGGGEGEYAEVTISTPAATYTYTVGAGGTAGAAGTNGGAGAVGGSGFICVDEYY